MSLLFAGGPDQGCTCDLALALGLTEATVSHHLAVLRRAGLVSGERRGANVHYRANEPALSALCRVIDPHCCS
jgi:DNA-binding transcriptional ArsR family regulator